MSDFTSYGYEIIERLGHNTYGGRIAYKAVNLNNHQPVVLKQFQFIKDSTWEDYKIIEQEIKTLQKLEHSGIPRYLNHFDSGDGICLVQEYKDALPLSLQRSWTRDRIKDIAIKLLEILVYLQNRIPPVIHRDIKPENILIDEQFNIYLVDFGFSRIGEGSVNLSSFAAGTFGFMPPEQLHNLSLTKASDLYGLGATLICLITGTKSTEIGNLIDLSSNCLQFEHRVSEFSVEFIRWLKQMVRPDPKQRFSNAQEALKALESISITRSPEVKLSQSVLEFKATRLVEKITQTITIENPIPETILEGSLQVAANSKDPPHTPNTHGWISITPKKFKSNKIKCKITVNTCQLKADSFYQRWILLHTNAALNPYKIKLKVQTASVPTTKTFISNHGNSRHFISVPIDVLTLPYNSFLLSLIAPLVTIVGAWTINTFDGDLLGEISNDENLGAIFFTVFFGISTGTPLGVLLGWLLGRILGSLLGSQQLKQSNYEEIGGNFGAIIVPFLVVLAGVSLAVVSNSPNINFWTFYIKILVLSTLIIIGVKATIWTSIKTAKDCRKNNVRHRNTIILSRLIPAFGISLGVGLIVGLSNTWIIAALVATGLPVIKVIFDYDFKALKQWKQLTQRRQKEKYLIEP
ncbi:MAG: serine/threonine protein kinase [Hydrococcus sp. RU_2_2]|nr:serine/threonine protein kinase [Hydrococcus sp. RU_2_2]NJP20612.1 serine/threonine protein kinase [Hydrococcus sp. CRU_1_1]